MSTLFDAAQKLAQALRKATDQHGRPNTFSCGEMEVYGGPPAMVSGRVGARFVLRARLHAALGGTAKWGSATTYSKGRWAV